MTLRRAWIVSLVGACLATTAEVAAESARSPAAWRVGVASVDITPQQPMWLAGYPAGRERAYDRVALPVFAKALWLEDGAGHRLAIVTLDLHGITPAMRQALERAAADRLGLKAHELVLNASHTHCGPEIRDPLIARPDLAGERVQLAARYRDYLNAQLAALLQSAAASSRPAKLHHGMGRAGFAMNRRPDFGLPKGHANTGVKPNPWGPVDHEVPVLQAVDREGRTFAVLFGYACHNTTLDGYELSADYAGYAQQSVERSVPGCTALFMMGCGGDQNPHPRRSLSLAQQHGQSLANAVLGALTAARETIRPGLRSALGTVELFYAPPPSRAELETRLSAKPYFEADHARLLLRQLDQTGGLPASYRSPVQVIKLGQELLLVALSGEVVVDYSLRLKRELAGIARVWVAGYCNDVFTYVPSERVLAEGDYEGGRCMRYTETMGLHPGPWAPGLENRIVGLVHQLVAEISTP